MYRHCWTVLWLAVALLLTIGATTAAVAESDLPTATDQTAALWSSGWRSIAAGDEITLNHNLGGDPATYAMELWFRDQNDGLGIHQRHYGGNASGTQDLGASWQRMTSSSIRVNCMEDETQIDQFYLRLWNPETPAWDSGWQNIAQGATLSFIHNLGGNVDDYVVGMRYDDNGAAGINHIAFGGLDDMGIETGVAWHNLTPTSIQVRRFDDDVFASRVRIQIYLPSIPAAYDSGWRSINKDSTLSLNHNVGGSVDGYVVRFSTRSAVWGINTMAAGGKNFAGNERGAHWQQLNNSSIVVYRWPDDIYAAQVRVRIYLPTQSIYLPLIANE